MPPTAAQASNRVGGNAPDLPRSACSRPRMSARGHRRARVSAEAECDVEVRCYPRQLVIEFSCGDVLELFLAAPRGPLGLAIAP